ncbi:MAG: phosphotransferase [Sulfurovum sp.]|nr:phosphotransferase [Sulfurovum sp.]
MQNITLSKLSFASEVKKEDITLLPKQGFSNENYHFTVNNKKYLLRKFKLQDRNRTLEYEVQTLAYEHGFAAKPLHLDLSQGFMVCDYLEGKHKEVLSRENLSLFSEHLQTLHHINLDTEVLNLKSLFKILSTELKEAFKTIDSFSNELVLCHNDLNPKNCIFLEKTLKFIDWEFSALNDCYFDLATVCVEFDLNNEDEKYFLSTYFKMHDWEKEKLEAYKVIYKALCAEWFEDNM